MRGKACRKDGAQPVHVRAEHAQAIDPGIFLFPARPLGEVAKVQRAAAFFCCVVPHPQARPDQRRRGRFIAGIHAVEQPLLLELPLLFRRDCFQVLLAKGRWQGQRPFDGCMQDRKDRLVIDDVLPEKVHAIARRADLYFFILFPRDSVVL